MNRKLLMISAGLCLTIASVDGVARPTEGVRDAASPALSVAQKDADSARKLIKPATATGSRTTSCAVCAGRQAEDVKDCQPAPDYSMCMQEADKRYSDCAANCVVD